MKRFLLVVAFALGPGRLDAQGGLWGSSMATLAQNRSNASGTSERVAGLLAGFQAGTTFGRLWEADFALLGGKLTPRETPGDNRTLGEARVRVGLVAMLWGMEEGEEGLV